ncbi:aminopeptidase N [Shewanella cyperi]|uniref:aminopeptidase N n=1 Tax=Shewanella cyperi TaxID=2814292 RepID=UPI001A94CAC0|nr:aminopeptidase N [Shewanella cyperi]QSX41438.1 aminopeptidase N [Shewanella cyperi]
MKLFKTAVLALALGNLFSCAVTPHFDPTKRDGSAFISAEQAAERSARVSNVRYELDFDLTGAESFNAISKVSFELADTEGFLTLDLNQAQVKSFSINGNKLYPKYNGSYFEISGKLLNKGENSIEVQFSRKHSTNGEGLHRFVDPVDGKVYLYSHFEPAAAQQMFALFDQPDLKASYQLTVTAPADWQVVSATREQQIEDQGERRRWHFPATAKLSPYNFSMHAGPYRVWEDSRGPYPMRLFARQSVAAQVNPEDWFSYTSAGLKFFDDYFGIAYPFGKYDQLLVPDFLYGAMENAGAITFAEGHFLSSSAMSSDQKQSLAGVIMHEMAHQWFGDLVTMKWWNGLWLNESFASFMGTLALAESTEFKHAWQSFYAKGKQRAYEQDSLVTTHPIEVPVATTANAFDNIDAITYQKGASVLKQLRHLLGEETFRRGVSQYLQTYAWQNATLDDFIASLGQAAGRDLSQWTRDWLYSAGVNNLKTELVCESGKISFFSLTQSAPADLPTLREQKVQVALFQANRRELERTQLQQVTYKGERTRVPALEGLPCPDLVYPNYGDWGFVKVVLNDRSFATAKQALGKVEDPMLRAMLWQSLWDSVNDGQLGLDQYIATALVNAPAEQDEQLSAQIISSLLRSADYLQASVNDGHYSRNALLALSQMSLRKTMESKGQHDLQRSWFEAWIELAYGKDASEHLRQLLEGRASILGLTLDQDLRWAIIARLNRLDAPDSATLIQDELTRDPSDAGQKAAISAEAQRPEAAIKRRWLQKIHLGSEPFPKLRPAMGALYPPEQQLLSQASADERLSQLTEMDKRGPVFMRSYVQLIPTQCSREGIDQLSQVLDSKTNLSSGLRRALLNTRQQEERCLMIRRGLPQG